MKSFSLVCLLLCSMGAFAQVSESATPASQRFGLWNVAIPTSALPALDMARVAQEDADDAQNGRLPKIGRIIPTNLTLDNSGVWTTLANGDRIWQLRIDAAGALANNLYFDNFSLPEGAQLFVFNADRSEYIGAFTTANCIPTGEFATAQMLGTACIIEYYEPLEVYGQGRFTLSGVGSAYRDIYPNFSSTRDFGDAGSCNVNVNCSPEGNNWQDEKRAVARILVRVGAQQGWCTGSVVNNVRQDCTPYFLTAWHCGEGASVANFNQWVFYFNFEASTCSNPAQQPSSNNITGCTMRANSNDGGGATGSDLLLVEFNSAIPANYNVYYAGWNAANTAATSGTGIHHPAGDIKKISTYNNALTSASYGGQVSNTHWRVIWNSTANGHGITEGGSSGSAIFNSAGLIVGTLTGGTSFCNNLNGYDLYGKVSYHWTSNGAQANRRLKDWLDPDNTGTTQLLGAFAPCNAAQGLDAGISTIVAPGAATCSNTFKPIVILQNYGTVTLTSCEILYRINNNPNQTFNWTGSLAAGATATVTLPTMNTPAGAFTFTAASSDPNNGTDTNPANDSRTANVTPGLVVNAATPPYQQNFENATFPPTGMQNVNPNNDDFAWERATNASGFGVGTASALFNNFDGTQQNNPNGTFDLLILPPLNFANAQSSTMTFDVAHADWTQGGNTLSDTLYVAYSLDCDNVYYFTQVYAGATLTTAPATAAFFTPSAAQWLTKTVNLNFLAGQPVVYLAFINKSAWGNNTYIDNINLSMLVGNETVAVPLTSFDLFPNPTEGQFTVAFELTEAQPWTLNVVNALGQNVYTQTGEALTNRFAVNLPKVAAGVYFVTLATQDGVETRRLIVQP